MNMRVAWLLFAGIALSSASLAQDEVSMDLEGESALAQVEAVASQESDIMGATETVANSLPAEVDEDTDGEIDEPSDDDDADEGMDYDFAVYQQEMEFLSGQTDEKAAEKEIVADAADSTHDDAHEKAKSAAKKGAFMSTVGAVTAAIQNNKVEKKNWFADFKQGTVLTCEGKLLAYKSELTRDTALRDKEISMIDNIIEIVDQLNNVGSDETALIDSEDDEALVSKLLADHRADRPHDESGAKGIAGILDRLVNKLKSWNTEQSAKYKAAGEHCIGTCDKVLDARTKAIESAEDDLSDARERKSKATGDRVEAQEELREITADLEEAKATYAKDETVRNKEQEMIALLIAKLKELVDVGNEGAASTELISLLNSAMTPSFLEVSQSLHRGDATTDQIAHLLKGVDAKIEGERKKQEKEIADIKAHKAAKTKDVEDKVKIETTAEFQRKSYKAELAHRHVLRTDSRRRCRRIDSVVAGKSLDKVAHCVSKTRNPSFTLGYKAWRANQKVSFARHGKYVIVKAEQGTSTPGIRQDGVVLSPGARYRVTMSGYKESAGRVCPYVDNGAGKVLLWGCNDKTSLKGDQTVVSGYFTASSNESARHRVMALFSGQKAGDTFAVRRISVCRVEEDAQEETKQALLEEFQDDEE